MAGADEFGFVRLYAPNSVESGSSVSHWVTTAFPNLLMEPFINDDLTGSTNQDLTTYQFTDIGWTNVLGCPVDTDDSGYNIMIGDCDSQVANISVFSLFERDNRRSQNIPANFPQCAPAKMTVADLRAR